MSQKDKYIMAVLGSNDFYSSHISVMECVEHILVCHKNIHEVWFNNEFIIGLLKMWPNLLDQRKKTVT